MVLKYSVPNPNKTGEDLLPVTGTHLDAGNGVDFGVAKTSLAASRAGNPVAAEFTPGPDDRGM